MTRLENISVEKLENALANVDGKRETQRLMAAIISKHGPSVPMIAEWINKREATIYQWFDWIETEPIKQAVTDDPRPGRPSKHTDEEREQFESVLQEPPDNVGIDAPAWTPKIARHYLREEFDAEYTLRHVRRLLTDAGLSWQTPRPQPPTAATDRRRR